MVRAKLSPEIYQFDFVDAPHPSAAGPGVQSFFDGPYLTWFKDPTTFDVREAGQALHERLRGQHPPYDTVVCFSQGCSVLSSLIIFHQTECPGEPLPFRSAMFICGGIPLYVLGTWLTVPEKAKLIAEGNHHELHATSEHLLKRRQLLNDDNDSNSPSWGMPPLEVTDVYGLDLSLMPPNLRLTLPTVHVFGRKDPVRAASLQLAMMCDPENRLVYDHGGGHEIPRFSTVTGDLVHAIQWLGKRQAQLARAT